MLLYTIYIFKVFLQRSFASPLRLDNKPRSKKTPRVLRRRLSSFVSLILLVALPVWVERWPSAAAERSNFRTVALTFDRVAVAASLSAQPMAIAHFFLARLTTTNSNSMFYVCSSVVIVCGRHLRTQAMQYSQQKFLVADKNVRREDLSCLISWKINMVVCKWF